MGRISSKQIKRNSRNLLESRQDFTPNFEKNKEILESYNLPDKGTRNKIAGYISRLKKAEKAKTKKQ